MYQASFGLKARYAFLKWVPIFVVLLLASGVVQLVWYPFSVFVRFILGSWLIFFLLLALLSAGIAWYLVWIKHRICFDVQETELIVHEGGRRDCIRHYGHRYIVVEDCGGAVRQTGMDGYSLRIFDAEGYSRSYPCNCFSKEDVFKLRQALAALPREGAFDVFDYRS